MCTLKAVLDCVTDSPQNLLFPEAVTPHSFPTQVSDPRAHPRSPHPPFRGRHGGCTLGSGALILSSSLYFPQLSWTRRGGLFPWVCLNLSPGKSPCPSSGPALKVTIATIRFILWGFKFIFGDSGHARAQPFLLTHVPLLPVSFRPKRGRILEN